MRKELDPRRTYDVERVSTRKETSPLSPYF